jgi:prevent-host-death family protein
MRTASVSDLKNNLSARLKQVIAGEPLIITDHRKPVAVVYPLEQELMDEHVRSLIAEGLVIPPRRREKLDAKAFLALPKAECKAGLTEAILEERREGR